MIVFKRWRQRLDRRLQALGPGMDVLLVLMALVCVALLAAPPSVKAGALLWFWFP